MTNPEKSLNTTVHINNVPSLLPFIIERSGKIRGYFLNAMQNGGISILDANITPLDFQAIPSNISDTDLMKLICCRLDISESPLLTFELHHMRERIILISYEQTHTFS